MYGLGEHLLAVLFFSMHLKVWIKSLPPPSSFLLQALVNILRTGLLLFWRSQVMLVIRCCRSAPRSQLWLHMLPAQARSTGDHQMQWVTVKPSVERLGATATRSATIPGRMRVVGMPGDATQQSATGVSAAGRVFVTPTGTTGRPQGGATGKDRLSGTGHVSRSLSSVEGTGAGNIPTIEAVMTAHRRLSGPTLAGLDTRRLPGCAGPTLLPGVGTTVEQRGPHSALAGYCPE